MQVGMQSYIFHNGGFIAQYVFLICSAKIWALTIVTLCVFYVRSHPMHADRYLYMEELSSCNAIY